MKDELLSFNDDVMMTSLQLALNPSDEVSRISWTGKCIWLSDWLANQKPFEWRIKSGCRTRDQYIAHVTSTCCYMCHLIFVTCHSVTFFGVTFSHLNLMSSKSFLIRFQYQPFFERNYKYCLHQIKLSFQIFENVREIQNRRCFTSHG